MVEILHSGSKCQACWDVVINLLLTVEHSEPVVVEASQETSPVSGSFADEETFEALDSFEETVVEKVLDTGDYFHVVEWQVVLNWVSMWVLVGVQRLEQLPFDFHSSVTFHVPFDEAFEPDCVLVESGGSLGLPVALPLTTEAGWSSLHGALPKKHVDLAVPNEIAAGIEFVVVLHALTLERLAEPPDS